MLGLVSCALALLSFATAQQTNFSPGTGTRSLWLPYVTVSGTPLASILGRDTKNNETTYVLSCPTASPNCALAPNLTLTEGTDIAVWTSSTSGSSTSGTVVISCPSLTNTQFVCHQQAIGGGNVRKTSITLGASDITYQAVDVTATSTDTSTLPKTVTVTAKPTSTTSSTSSSKAGVGPVTGAPWGVGGAVGAGLLALAAL